MFNTPILFLIFNRPDTTERVFDKIREAKPKRLFIAADGPREGNEYDKINCKTARAMATNVDWECEVHTLLREDNLGCGLAVSQAITWFFDHVEEGIILEDDTLPDVSFFSFCQELLERYRNNPKVMMISGDNFLNEKIKIKHSYYFSNYFHIWGWATWRSSWINYDQCLGGLKNFMLRDFKFFGQKEKRYWNELFYRVKTKEIDTWDYVWFMSIWNCNGISINPGRNLVKNIGFGPEATHTKVWSKIYIREAESLKEIVHPVKVEINYKADNYTAKYVILANTSNDIKNQLKCLIGKYLRKVPYQIIKSILKGRDTFPKK